MAQGAAAPVSKITPNEIRYVILVSMDGLGSVYLRNYLDDPAMEIPNFRRLASEGAWTLNARNDYDSPLTEPNHTTILTGRPVLQQPTNVPYSAPHGYSSNYDPGPSYTLHNLGNLNVPYKAGIFDVAHDYGFATAFYAGKQKFDLFTRTWDVAHGALDVVGEDNGTGKIDRSVILDYYSLPATPLRSSNLVTAALAWLSNAPPALVFVHLADPDIIGHYQLWGSAEYSNCVRHMDAQLGRMFAAIEAHPGLSNQTAIVLTADHGGGDAAQSHIYPSARQVYTIPLMVWGPGVRAGTDLYGFFSNRGDPLNGRPDYSAWPQPLRNGDAGNIALALLGLPGIPGSCLVPEVGPPVARLTFQHTASEVTLSWPAYCDSYALEYADRCDSEAEWVPVAGDIVRNSQSFSISLPTAAATRFFRLRHAAD